MSQMTQEGVKTYTSAGPIGRYLRVKRVGTKVDVAGATDDAVGSTEMHQAFAADQDIPVRIRTAQGTRILTASGAIPAGADVFAAAGGKVAAAGTKLVGTNEGGAVADGEYLEVLPV